MADLPLTTSTVVSKGARPCLRNPSWSCTRTSLFTLATAIAACSHFAPPYSESTTAPSSAWFACPWLLPRETLGIRPQISAISRQIFTSRGRRCARQSTVARQSAGTAASAEFEAETDVDNMGLKLVSLPPGRVIIKQAVVGMWAAEQGFLAGAELSAINGQRVAEMSRDQFVSAMSSRPIRIQMSLDPRELTRELTMTTSASAVLRVIAPWVDGPHFNDIHMAAAIYRLGVHSEDFTEQIAASQVFQMLIERIQGAWDLFDERQIANIFWAIAKMRAHATCFKVLLPGLTEWVATRGDTMGAQGVANTLWSIAVLRNEAPSLQSLPARLAQAARQQAPRMLPQAISNIIWALGVLRCNGEEIQGLLDTLCTEAAEKIGSFKPQALANTCQGLVELGVQHPTLMTLIADEVVTKERWSKKELTLDLPTIIWARARFGLNSSDILEVASQVLPPAIHSLPDWNLCALLWSYIKLDTGKDYADVGKQLKVEASRRGLDAQAVIRARLGPEEWTSA